MNDGPQGAAQPGLLVGYKGDAGPDVLSFTRRWVAATSDPVTVASVYPGPAPGGFGRVDAEWVAYGRSQAEEWLAQARQGLGDLPATYRTIGSESASRGLHELAEAGSADSLIVLGSRKTQGGRRTAPGSTADRLLQGTAAPVVLVPWDYESAADQGLTRLSVAYVDTPDGNVALEHATRLARRTGASMRVISVVPQTRMVPSFGDASRFRHGLEQEYRRSLVTAVDRLPEDVGATPDLRSGSVVDALSDLTLEETDLLVCGSRGYGPARRVLLGGVSSRVLKHSRVPVVVVPRG